MQLSDLARARALLIFITIETVGTLALYGIGMHTVRFLSDCAYTRLCAPQPSWNGFFLSFVTANSDACTALRKTTGVANDAIALLVVSGLRWLSRTTTAT